MSCMHYSTTSTEHMLSDEPQIQLDIYLDDAKIEVGGILYEVLVDRCRMLLLMDCGQSGCKSPEALMGLVDRLEESWGRECRSSLCLEGLCLVFDLVLREDVRLSMHSGS